MPIFARSFATDDLKSWATGKPGNAVHELFQRWALPGEPCSAEKPLRLGVRDGYLNFYAKGQSVAKLSMSRGGPKLSVHIAYVEGRARTSERSDGPAAQGYQDLDADALASPQTAALVQHWIDTAVTYASAEKRFVDDLVGANPGVIDLEMGLPASDLPGSDRVAPRMDLVVAELGDSASPSIAFWEAKCANNGELRASSDYVRGSGEDRSGPKVLHQLDRYVRWMEEDGRLVQVEAAYRKTAETLLALYRAFRTGSGDEPDCVRAWDTLASAMTVAVVVRPGIVVGNYWPEGHPEPIASQRMAQSAASFVRNGHREKLERHGVLVHEVGPDHDGLTLPALTSVAA